MKVQSIYKKREKESWTHKGPSIQKTKRERQPMSKERKREREIVHERSPHTIHTKIFTHMHILIKVYDLFLLRIQSLTQQNMRSRCAFNPLYLQLHKNSHQRKVEEVRHNKKPWYGIIHIERYERSSEELYKFVLKTLQNLRING